MFTDLDYADDAVLFAQDPGRWQAELKRFDDAANTMGCLLYTSDAADEEDSVDP